jgi:phage terminase large subunit-like protein
MRKTDNPTGERSRREPTGQGRVVADGGALTADLVPLERLVEADWNANRVPAKTLSKLRRSIERYGCVQNLVARAHPERPGSFEVLSGNHRLRVLHELAYREAPVVVVELGDADARLLAQALNRLAGTDDPQAYAQSLERMLEQFTPLELTELLPETEATLEQALRAYRPREAELVLEPEPTGEPDSKLGELYELGPHRLLCGNATNPDHVKLLMAGEQATLLATDPPYGVGLDHGWRDGVRQPAGSARAGQLVNDDQADWTDAYLLMEAPVAYVWHSALHSHEVRAGLVAAGFVIRAQIIWTKTIHVLSRGAYQWAHEPCWYAVRKGCSARWQGGRRQTTVWPASSPDHVLRPERRRGRSHRAPDAEAARALPPPDPQPHQPGGDRLRPVRGLGHRPDRRRGNRPALLHDRTRPALVRPNPRALPALPRRAQRQAALMARPAKSLLEHILDGTFRARRHHPLLAGPDLPWPGFAYLQQRYRAATSEPERRAIALELEQAVRQIHASHQVQASANGDSGLHALLGELGKPGTAAHLLKFFPAFFTHPKGPAIGQPFSLELWQKQFLREFYRRDRRGRRIYRLGVLGLPRGNGKTPIAAGLGLYELVCRDDAPEVYCAAGSKEQAQICLDFARSFVEQGELDEHIQVKSTLSRRGQPGVMQVISSEGRLQHGRAPAASILDELWAFETARQEQTYIALSSALHKREDAFLLAITTAGYDRQSLLGRIYEHALGFEIVEISPNGCLTIAKDLENGSLLWWYGGPDDCDLEDEQVWRACNPASWITLRDLRRQLNDPGLDENEFRRLHLNQWTRSRDAWLPTNCWHNLQSDHEIRDGAPIFVGVDIGLYHDTSAVCWAHLLEDGRLCLRAHVWSAREDAPAHTHVPGGKVNLEQIEQFIRELARRYKIREVAYDPRFFERSAQILEAARLTMVEFLPGSAPIKDAYQRFYQEAIEGKLTHNGDPVFAAHVEATAADQTERGWRIRKLKSSQPIDALVAAVLAIARARIPKRPAPNVFWMEV